MQALQQQLHIQFVEEWIRAAKEFLQSNRTTNPKEDLLQLVLFGDLKDIVAVPVLPPQLSLKDNYTVSGKYTLQIEDFRDVTRSRQEQEEAGRASRLLKLRLTDGHQHVVAMEYRPLPQLEPRIGLKLEIRDVLVKHGVMLLVPAGVTVLGGAVVEEEPTESPPHSNGSIKVEPPNMELPALETDQEIFNAPPEDNFPDDITLVDDDSAWLIQAEEEIQKLETMNAKKHAPPDQTTLAPYTYLQNIQLSNGSATYTIYGTVFDTVPPLMFNSGKFSLKVKISDGTACIEAKLSDRTIAGLLGMSCAEFQANMKTDAGKQQNSRALKKMESALAAAEGEMDLEVVTDDPLAWITRIETPSHDSIVQFSSHLSQRTMLL